jgi:hypothetical protein
MSIQEVKIGHIAAEEEADELRNYFLETPEYVELLGSSTKMIVVGRKGSGKSAIYVNLRDVHSELPNTKVIALQLDNYPWEVHKKIIDETGASHRTYVPTWGYLMLVELIKKIIQYEYPKIHKIFDSIFWRLLFNANYRKLQRFMMQTYGQLAPNFAELLIDRARRLIKINIQGVGVEVSDETDEHRRLSKNVSQARRYLQTIVLSTLSKKHNYFIIFDQLDRGWDSSEETKQMLIGLILASRDLLRDARQAGKSLRVIIFLRDDIYSELSFEDKNKLTPDLIKLVWNAQRLQELINQRVRKSSGLTWENIVTDQDIRNRQKSFPFMLKRTLLRPRDIINFCRESLEHAISVGHSRIERDDITFAEQRHSTFMRDEYLDETRANHPYFTDLLNIIRELGTSKLNTRQFIDIYEDYKARGYDLPLQAKDALQILIELSVLGLRRPQAGGGRPWTYRYLEEPTVRLEPKYDGTETIEVHPCLIKVLNLSEKTPNKEDNSDEDDND